MSWDGLIKTTFQACIGVILRYFKLKLYSSALLGNIQSKTPNSPALFPHLHLAMAWGLTTRPTQKRYAQKHSSYGPDTHVWNKDPRNFQNAKFCVKPKNFKFGTKNALFRYFWDVILKTFCHVWNQPSQIH